MNSNDYLALLGTGFVAASSVAAVIYPLVNRRENKRTKQNQALAAKQAELDEAKETARQLTVTKAVEDAINTKISPVLKEVEEIRSLHRHQAELDEAKDSTRRLEVAQAVETAIRTAVAPVERQVDAIRSQWSPNGGTSALDRLHVIGRSVDATASKVDGLIERFEDHLEQSTEDRARLAELEKRQMRRKESGDE